MKVLIADDHALIRQGMAHALMDHEVANAIVEADDRDSVLACLEQEQGIDVILLDLFMPGSNDFELLERVCNDYPNVSVIVVSAAEEPHIMRKSIDTGASGFIPKSASMDIMLSAIQLVRSGGTYIPRDMMKASSDVSQSVPKPGMPVVENPEEVEAVLKSAQKLTRRQRDVLALMAQGKSNKEIARELGVSEHTVKIHVTAILRLFKASNRTEVVVKARNARILKDM